MRMRMKTRCLEIRLERLGGLGFQIWRHRWNQRASKGGAPVFRLSLCVLLLSLTETGRGEANEKAEAKDKNMKVCELVGELMIC